MTSNNRRTLLGMAVLMGLGLFAVGTAPAAADPPSHAKAWGWRKKQSGYDRDYRYRSDYRRRDYDDDYRYRSDRYRSRYDGNYRHYGNDIDGDGIPNSRDRDIDGDGHPNWRDHKPYGSGYDNSGGSRYRSRRRR